MSGLPLPRPCVATCSLRRGQAAAAKVACTRQGVERCKRQIMAASPTGGCPEPSFPMPVAAAPHLTPLLSTIRCSMPSTGSGKVMARRSTLRQ